MSDDSDPDRHPIDLLAEEFAQRCRAGEHPSVSDYIGRYPELADELRDLLPSIAMMEKLKGSRRSQSSAVATAPRIERLGDFRIVREVGRGGMGVVYEAVQESLGRSVALKVLSTAATLDPTRLQRFEQEARAAARLHHTNIVPVFGVSEQDGIHYYVMQLIEGQALGDVVKSIATQHPARRDALRARRGGSSSSIKSESGGASSAGAAPVWTPVGDAATAGPADARFARYYWRWVARVGLQVAQALQYAHQQGVLHRDVKPANLLLDARGMVWVTDFGLAKVGDDSNVTRTGDIVGTLQYIAPEALKKQADLRSDVYGLGLTLHEMLTLRQPYGDSHPGELIRRISTTDPPRPTSINPAIPRDLETIVLKATARDPGHRYQTAGEMAADLEAFLQDRPIRARRASTGERLWRWCRRNRAVASLSAAAMLLAVVAIVVGWVGYANTRQALAGESKRRSEAEFATRRAEKNVQLSLAAFEEIFNQVSQQESFDPQPPPPQQGPPGQRSGRDQQAQSSVDVALLQSVLTFYDKFAQENATNPILNAEAARSYRRAGDLYRWLGQNAKADQAYERSASMYDDLLTADGSQRDFARGLAESASAIAYAFGAGDPGERDKQIRRLRLAIKVLDGAGQTQPSEPQDARALARAFDALGMGLEEAGNLTDAEAAYRRSIDLWIHSPPPDKPGPPGSPDRANVALSLANLLGKSDRDTQALDVIKQAIQDEEHEMSKHEGPGRPGQPPRGDSLARLYDALADLQSKLKDTVAATKARKEAENLRALSSRAPGGNRPPLQGGGPRPPRDGPPPRRGE